jgi:hypothetical protein
MAFLSIVENAGTTMGVAERHATTILAGIAVTGPLMPTAGTDGRVTEIPPATPADRMLVHRVGADRAFT